MSQTFGMVSFPAVADQALACIGTPLPLNCLFRCSKYRLGARAVGCRHTEPIHPETGAAECCVELSLVYHSGSSFRGKRPEISCRGEMTMPHVAAEAAETRNSPKAGQS